MFRGESEWIREALAGMDLPAGSEALDVGCSVAAYRSTLQPHVQENVRGPLEARGVTVVGLDIKQEQGVDVVCDITDDPGAVLRTVGRRFPLLLCNNTLVHVGDVNAALRSLVGLVADHGHLLVTTPRSFRKTDDPFDNAFRPHPEELAERIGAHSGGAFELVRAELLRIDDADYYRRGLHRSHIQVGSRWIMVPAFVEQLRRRVPRLRWTEACVLMRRA